MKRPVFAWTLAALCVFSLPSHADEIDDAIGVFMNEDGFERQDVQVVDARLLRQFKGTGAMRPDGSASPLEKALLLIDAMEKPLVRTRYMVRYGQMQQEDTPISFVTVERYNLGPAIRTMVAQDYGEENTAGPEEFGVGPHVEWRIVTMPLMGQSAALVEVARREIPEKEAGSVDCAGRGCLSLDGSLDTVREWSEARMGVNVATAYSRTNEAGSPVPALVAAELAVAGGIATGAGGETYWTGPERPEAARDSEPFLFLAVDFDLGQDTNVDAALGQTLLNDDSLAETWVRRNQFAGAEDVYWFTSNTERTH